MRIHTHAYRYVNLYIYHVYPRPGALRSCLRSSTRSRHVTALRYTYLCIYVSLPQTCHCPLVHPSIFLSIYSSTSLYTVYSLGLTLRYARASTHTQRERKREIHTNTHTHTSISVCIYMYCIYPRPDVATFFAKFDETHAARHVTALRYARAPTHTQRERKREIHTRVYTHTCIDMNL